MSAAPYTDVVAATGAALCVECGKCVALCPLAEILPDFSRRMSPRGVVRQALRGVPVEDMPGVAACLQCRSCSETCPAGVDVAGLIAGLRQRFPAESVSRCAGCGATVLPSGAEAYLIRAISRDFETQLGYASLCPRCRRQAYIRNNR